MRTRRNILLGSAVLLAILILVFGAGYTCAQSVPATARQAASMPQYAAKLAHPAASQQRPRLPSPAGACSMDTRNQPDFSPLDDIFYSNGPINGTTDAWTINFGFVVADSFTVSGGGASSLNFGAWVFPGDVLQSVEVSITSAPFGGTTYFDGIVTLTQSNCSGNQYGYNVCTETGNFSGVGLNGGTYWINLQNAVVNTGDPAYWDENSGPSMAQFNEVGTIPSEAFTLGGSGNGCMPEQAGAFKVIHDFSGGGDGGYPSGVATDLAGNLYGAAQSGGGGGGGTVFKMAEFGVNWVLTSLHDFVDGDNSGHPREVIVGRNGILYGSVYSDIYNCSPGVPCDLVFALRPSPTVCRSISCSWTENALYRFDGRTDAWGSHNLLSDHNGNIYGLSTQGGAQQQGAVFELSPSLGGWVETIIYSFAGGRDGGNPGALLLGNNGDLYGMAGTGGANGSGVVFQLTRSASGWTETVIFDLPYSLYGTSPHSLLQDSNGNFFGVWNYWYEEPIGSGETLGVIFELSPSNGTWVYTELRRGEHQFFTNDLFGDLALDAAGNLWGTGGGAAGCVNPTFHGYIFKLARGSDGWQYSTPEYWDHTRFDVSGRVAIDGQGNLYGTTYSCGRQNQGTVWQFTP